MSTAAFRSAYYSATVPVFLEAPNESILGALTARSAFAVDLSQRDAWQTQLDLLRTALSGLDGMVFLEFDVPRIGSRIDAVLVSGPVVFVIEFKVGEATFNTADYNQAWDYALDLKNFHLASHRAPIVPILVASEAPDHELTLLAVADDGVYPPVRCNASTLGNALRLGLTEAKGTALDPLAWASSRYQPTPTIIEAAQALYAHHSVESIARHEADAQNLGITSQRIEEVVETARSRGHKAIIFVTGVPGAGKTLVGLNLATKRRGDAQNAVFLSGNGPLVTVLREALARDEVARSRARGGNIRKGVAQQKVKAFIQNVHHFRDEGLNQPGPPVDRVVIFDEAQRAWNREMTADFMKRKRGRPGFTHSEPEVLLEYLDRHPDWAVVVCLVGGGQEINRGEAGISAWLDAVSTTFTNWSAYISPNLTDTEYAAGHALGDLGTKVSVVTDEALHLSVSMRSFRAEHVSKFVKAVLDMERTDASGLLRLISSRYPIVLTRDLEQAKSWIRRRARGSERYGLVASSGALRLKPHAVDVRMEVDPVHYFLNDPSDTRSSFYMEDAATEFQVQGLELDWVVVNWDADFRFAQSGWSCHSFVASRWYNVNKSDRRSYLKNAYRVLLTRARQGMAIFVPPGNSADPTRPPAFYDSTFEYLRSVGIPVISTTS
jgi:hypothetical protein